LDDLRNGWPHVKHPSTFMNSSGHVR